MRILALALAMIGIFLEPSNVIAQATANSPTKLKAELLDRLLPLGGESRPSWLDKITVRFSNSLGDYGEVARPDGQLVLVTYRVDPPAHPDPESELISYTIRSKSGEDLSKLIHRMLDGNPNMSTDEIVGAVVVDVSRSSISMKERDKLLRGLTKLKLSPVLTTRICVDNCPQYDYWHDTGQEVVHYTLYGGDGTDPQDQLTRWMDSFLSTYSDMSRTR